MLKKRRFLAVNSTISEKLDQSCNQKPALSPLATSLVCKNGCLLQVTVSRNIITSKLQSVRRSFKWIPGSLKTPMDTYSMRADVNSPG